MSDFAAVRIHSKMTSIFSSLADHLAEALDGGRAILAADRGAPLEELVEQIVDDVVCRAARSRTSARRGPATFFGDAERDELAHAVLDVEPHAAERLHQRLDVEGLLGPRAQEAQDPGAQRRLDERLELRGSNSAGSARRAADVVRR